jgi:hypothetical protein
MKLHAAIDTLVKAGANRGQSLIFMGQEPISPESECMLVSSGSAPTGRCITPWELNSLASFVALIAEPAADDMLNAVVRFVAERASFQSLSIRGRVAHALECIASALGQQAEQRLAALIDQMWSFTASEHLDEWESSTASVMDEALATESADTRSLFELVMELAEAHLYSSISGYGSTSVAALVVLRTFCGRLGASHPSPPDPESYAFRVERGWGRPFDREEWMRVQRPGPRA